MLEFGTVQVDTAVNLYQQYVSKVPFVDDDRGRDPPAEINAHLG